MTPQLYTALISEHHVGKVVASMLPGKVQPLLHIHIPYELAVGTPPSDVQHRRMVLRFSEYLMLVKRTCS